MSAMPAPFFDTLRFVERLTGVGVPEAQAKAEVEILRDVLAESLVTTLASKEDICRLETATREDFRRLETATKENIHRLEATTKEDFHRLEAATKEDFRQFEAATKEDFRQFKAATKEEIRQFEAATKEDIRGVREDIRRLEASSTAAMVALEQRMTIKLGSMLFLALGAFYTLTRLH